MCLKRCRIKSVVINSRIHSAVQRILLAHELGHAVLHREIALLRGFQEFELFDATDPTEYEANLFAAELLIEDDELLNLINDEDKSFFSIARELFVPAELLDFKLRVMKRKGYHMEAPYISHGDFLKNDIHPVYYGDRQQTSQNFHSGLSPFFLFANPAKTRIRSWNTVVLME